MSVLEISEILGLFVNTSTTMTSIPIVIGNIYGNQFKCNYLRNNKCFLNFGRHMGNLHQILNNLNENVTLISYAFPKLETP